MAAARSRRVAPAAALQKAPTGIVGLDEILTGGLPRGRPTLVCGDAGSGKSLLAIEFLVRGARQFREPGVLVAFEETGDDISRNVASLGYRLKDEIARRMLVIDYVHLDRSQISETGEYSLDGLFVRLEHAIKSIGAKRVVLDSLETLFAGLDNDGILRSELWRLFRWLKDHGVTAVITAERGMGSLTRHGLEEYVSDCVILMSHTVHDLIATRRLRVVKYRGSRHSTNEFPFLIGDEGLSVLPITSLGLAHTAHGERIPTGIAGLDAMLGKTGYFRGSSVLVSGASGSGKTSVAAHFIDAACRRGERALLFLMEESPSQLVRNMRSIGIDLERWIRAKRLVIHAARPSLYGLETHLVNMHRMTEAFAPHVVAIDPVSNLISIGSHSEARSVLTRLVDYMKTRNISAMFTSLTHSAANEDTSDVGISSIMDTWLSVRYAESNGERNRVLYVLKSRGMAHSNQVREFRMTEAGIQLVDAYVGTGGVLTGTARIAQEARDAIEQLSREDEFESRRVEIDRRREALRAQALALDDERKAAEAERRRIDTQEKLWKATQVRDRAAMATARHNGLRRRAAR